MAYSLIHTFSVLLDMGSIRSVDLQMECYCILNIAPPENQWHIQGIPECCRKNTFLLAQSSCPLPRHIPDGRRMNINSIREFILLFLLLPVIHSNIGLLTLVSTVTPPPHVLEHTGPVGAICHSSQFPVSSAESVL